MNKNETIFVGISGGVDSSVAAHLLKEQGYDVQGIFVKTWSPDWLPCTWVEEKRDAMRICAKLGIRFHFLDAEEEYKKGVADYMISEYKAGRTPNPDVLCNKIIKFGVMWQYAKDHGADGIATGHYARTAVGSPREKEKTTLLKGVDSAKDQSYFLWMIERDLLPHIQFPIGHLHKQEVRAIAEKAGLFTATKKDSQGICFLGDVDMKEFLHHYIDEKPGDVLNEEGEVIGQHDGAVFYTIGERHGFRITEKNTNRTPYYIIAKDVEKNTITVSADKKTSLEKNGEVMVHLREVNWLDEPSQEKTYTAQIRYHGTLLQAKIVDERIVQVASEESIPPCQSLVLYDKEKMIVGGIIDNIA